MVHSCLEITKQQDHHTCEPQANNPVDHTFVLAGWRGPLHTHHHIPGFCRDIALAGRHEDWGRMHSSFSVHLDNELRIDHNKHELHANLNVPGLNGDIAKLDGMKLEEGTFILTGFTDSSGMNLVQSVSVQWKAEDSSVLLEGQAVRNLGECEGHGCQKSLGCENKGRRKCCLRGHCVSLTDFFENLSKPEFEPINVVETRKLRKPPVQTGRQINSNNSSPSIYGKFTTAKSFYGNSEKPDQPPKVVVEIGGPDSIRKGSYKTDGLGTITYAKDPNTIEVELERLSPNDNPIGDPSQLNEGEPLMTRAVETQDSQTLTPETLAEDDPEGSKVKSIMQRFNKEYKNNVQNGVRPTKKEIPASNTKPIKNTPDEGNKKSKLQEIARKRLEEHLKKEEARRREHIEKDITRVDEGAQSKINTIKESADEARKKNLRAIAEKRTAKYLQGESQIYAKTAEKELNKLEQKIRSGEEVATTQGVMQGNIDPDFSEHSTPQVTLTDQEFRRIRSKFFEFNPFQIEASEVVEIGEEFKRMIGAGGQYGPIVLDKFLAAFAAYNNNLFAWKMLSYLKTRRDQFYPVRNNNGRKIFQVGAGVVGIRGAVEFALMGATVTVVEMRTIINRPNILHLWDWSRVDLLMMGMKSPWISGEMHQHVGTKEYQNVMIRAAILAGAKVVLGAKFIGISPPNPGGGGSKLFTALYTHAGENKTSPFDVIVDGSGASRRVVAELLEIPQIKERASKEAIGCVGNYERKPSGVIKRWPEHSLAQQFAKEWFDEAKNPSCLANGNATETSGTCPNVDVENIVIYQQNTLYVVMTVKRRSLISNHIIHKTASAAFSDLGTVDKANLNKMIKNSLSFFLDKIMKDDLEKNKLPRTVLLERGEALKTLREDVPKLRETKTASGSNWATCFDFSYKMYSEYSGRILIDPVTKRAAVGLLLGDALQVPFWPQGLGINRGGMSVFDTAGFLRNYIDFGNENQLFNLQYLLHVREHAWRTYQKDIEASTAHETIPTGLKITNEDLRKRHVFHTFDVKSRLGPKLEVFSLNIPKITDPAPGVHYIKYEKPSANDEDFLIMDPMEITETIFSEKAVNG
eukprot:jgi/Bigna1/82647/fgenesh1_pg.95_\